MDKKIKELMCERIMRKEKIHLIQRAAYDKRRVYICNQAVSITKGKYTEDPEKVTCKNCNRMIKDTIRSYRG